MMLHNPYTLAEEFDACGSAHFFEYYNDRGKDAAIDISRRDEIMLAERERAKAVYQHKTTRREMRAQREKSWKALEKAQKEGKVKYIGVANYTPALIREMEEYAEIMPCVNEVELHPNHQDEELQKLSKELGFVIIGYGTNNATRIRNHDVLQRIAVRHDTTPSMVALAWTAQKGIVVIPGARSVKHQRENLNAVLCLGQGQQQLHLTEEEMKEIDGTDEGKAVYWDRRPGDDSL